MPDIPVLGQEVEVLGHDDEVKYLGTYAGRDDDEPKTLACVWNPDTQEFHSPPYDHVRPRETA